MSSSSPQPSTTTHDNNQQESNPYIPVTHSGFHNKVSKRKSILGHDDARDSKRTKTLGVKADSKMGKQKKLDNASKKKQELYSFGNYRNYYELRRNPQSTTDQRLNMLDSELFKNKRVLDIGCNSGNITIMIGLHYHPSSIFGIDLDDGLIQKAEHQLRIVNSLHNPKGNDNTMDISMKYHYFPRALPSIHGVIPMTMPPNYKSTSFPYNVKFETNNWMEMDLIGHKHYYDTILALSITKWIHIHHGDDGLKDFFKKIYKALKHGGTMILEPQEYDTYERRAKLTDKTKLIFDTIQFKPEHFHDYLIKEVGFKEFKDLGYAEQHKEKGFQRPIHLYIK